MLLRRLPATWLLLLGLLCSLAWTPAAASPARALRFQHLSVDQGLSQESVLAIVQDSDGFMWFGTQAGLSRFDGYRVVIYRNIANDPRSLAHNWVRVLHLDRAGRLWVATDGGLDRFDPQTQSFVHYQPKESSKRGNGNLHIRALADDGKGGLWLGTSDGLQHLDLASGKFTIWHHQPEDPGSLGNDQVNALAIDGRGKLWVGTATGLDSLEPGAKSFQHFASPTGNPKFDVVQALLVDSAQTLWIGSLAGLERWKLDGSGTREKLGAAEGFKAPYVTALYQDTDANLWVGSHDDGLFRWDPSASRFAQYRHLATDPHSVADHQVSALYRDRVGTFWVGTWYAGVSRVDLNSGGFARIVRQADAADSLLDNKIRAIVETANGKLWMASNTGLNLVDPVSGQASVYRYDPEKSNTLPGLPASALARDKQGLLWVGSHTGLSSFDEATGRFTRHLVGKGDPDSAIIRGLMGDRNGMMWIATRAGIYRLNTQTNEMVNYRHNPADSNSLSDNVVRPMLEDRNGKLWIGTFNGLDLFDHMTGKFIHFRNNVKDAASLSNDEVHCLLEDSKGNLWVGTAGGLNRMIMDPDGSVRFRRYTTRDGMADDAVAAIQEDEDGNLWVSSNTAISRLEPATGRWRNYNSGDGTIEGAYFDASSLRASDGTLYFGGFNGVTAFNPRAVNDNLIAPRAVITGFQVFNKPIATVHPELATGPIESLASITLPASSSVFSLEFSALHYAAPNRNRFAYKLEGFDENWVNTDADKRFATYTNLDPGTYTFRVRAANKDGVWSASGASMTIIVQPPWWKTWWFRLGIVVLVLGTGFGIYRARLSGLRHQQRVLEQQVDARTVEINLQNRLLEHQKDELDTRRLEAEQQRADAEQRRVDAERQKEEVERQKENVELAHRNISVLSEIGREMTATLDLETIMGTVYRHVHHLMDARIFGIGFYHPDEGLIDFPFSMDQGVRAQHYTRSMNDPNQFAVWCLENQREVFINDLDVEYSNYIGRDGLKTLDVVPNVDGSRPSQAVAMMYVPMILKGRTMGLLCVQSIEKHAYRRVHLDMLQTLASHAAVALDNARAYRELEETQARLVEQERQVRLAKQIAEDSTRQKSEFLANMSHEMRTPLAGVIGMLGFALRDNQLASNTREQILRGQANAQSLLTIINDLLDFSKIEAGKLAIENIDYALGSAVENVVSLFEEQAAAHSVDFDIALAPDLPRFVVGDPTRLRQVLVNLVGNAFKFTNEGQVRLSVDRDGSTAAPAAKINMIRFSVSDTGIGIPKEALGRLFQKFEQADTSTTRRYGGTGLGLAICRQLVNLMGGEISVESREGVGSTFHFVLPLADGVAPPLVPQVPRKPHSHRLRVLCAEDFPTNQIIIRMMLEDLGHKVDIAENGVLAVAACATTRYDLILMDGRMPEMDGATATRLIRAGGPPEAPVRDQELMIIALTANASEEDRSRYLACGMDDFLTKPIDEAALHVQLSRAIERQLQRGIALPLMSERDADTPPSTAELDAMFGVQTGITPLTAAEAKAGRRASELRARLREAFASDVPSRRTELEAAVAREDSEAAGRLLHGIKGSAAYLDATELHLLCGELEVAADEGQWGTILAGMPRLWRLLSEFEPTPVHDAKL